MTILQDLEAARDALEESERIRKLGMEPDVHWESLRDARRESIAKTEAALSRLRARLEQVDAEPVAWRFHDGKTWCYVNHITDLSSSPKFFPLYTSPTPAAAPAVDVDALELPEANTTSLATSGRSVSYINGYEAGWERGIEAYRSALRMHLTGGK